MQNPTGQLKPVLRYSEEPDRASRNPALRSTSEPASGRRTRRSGDRQAAQFRDQRAACHVRLRAGAQILHRHLVRRQFRLAHDQADRRLLRSASLNWLFIDRLPRSMSATIPAPAVPRVISDWHPVPYRRWKSARPADAGLAVVRCPVRRARSAAVRARCQSLRPRGPAAELFNQIIVSPAPRCIL